MGRFFMARIGFGNLKLLKISVNNKSLGQQRSYNQYLTVYSWIAAFGNSFGAFSFKLWIEFLG